MLLSRCFFENLHRRGSRPRNVRDTPIIYYYYFVPLLNGNRSERTPGVAADRKIQLPHNCTYDDNNDSDEDNDTKHSSCSKIPII